MKTTHKSGKVKRGGVPRNLRKISRIPIEISFWFCREPILDFFAFQKENQQKNFGVHWPLVRTHGGPKKNFSNCGIYGCQKTQNFMKIPRNDKFTCVTK
jgi:hypothetical protein